MYSVTTLRLRRTVMLVLALALSISACGGDDAQSTDTTEQTETSTGAPSGNTDLVVPLDYLQGEWCNSDREAWLFEGDTARFGESHDELFGELPVSGAMAAGSQRVLVSQSDDEFVLDLQTRELTFTRGQC